MAPKSFDERQHERRDRRGDFRDPKKHFVRKNGWLPVFEKYSTIRKRRVRYLTLCAKEAIDVRYFANKGVLYRNAEGNLYPSLTFVEADPEDYAAIAESLGRVALPILGRIEDVLLDASHASHHELIGSFPYDVINLDFCGDIVPVGDHPYAKTLRCIGKIIEVQANCAPRPDWHLFLTCRAQLAMGSPEAHEQLKQRLNGNLERPEFLEAYGERRPPATLLEANYPEFLRLAVCKLLAHQARQHGYAVDVQQTFVYARHNGAYHIVKVVAAFRPLHALGQLPDPALEATEYDNCVKAVLSSDPVDVDVAIAAAHDETTADLAVVLGELQQLNIVTS
jgi:hypothetical protein